MVCFGRFGLQGLAGVPTDRELLPQTGEVPPYAASLCCVSCERGDQDGDGSDDAKISDLEIK